jgi:diguanylate cyclase (GGDEF)-like protein/PAS domain S-box-containing protein
VNRFLPSSLQVRLMLGVMALSLGSLWAFAWLLAARQAEKIEAMLIEQQRATVSYVAEDVDQRLRRRLDNLTQVATVLPLEALGDAAHLEDFIRQRPALMKLFDGGVILVRPDGVGAFADYPPLPGRRTQRFDHLTAVGDVIRNGSPTVGKPFVGIQTEKPMLGFAAPVRDRDGRLAAVIAGVSSVQSSDLLGIVGQHRYGKTGDLVVIATQHDIAVIGSDPANNLRPLPKLGFNPLLDRFRRGEEASGVAVDSRGVEQLASGKRLDSIPGWLVVARLPLSEAFAPVVELRRLVFGGALLLSLLLTGLVAFWVRRALTPLRQATGALDAISAGKAPLRALPVMRADEVGRLVESFNRLQQRLRRREDELVAAREEMREITDSVPVAMYRYRIDEDGRPDVMYMSDRIEALWGVSAADIMRDPEAGFACIHPDDLPAFLARDRADWQSHAPSIHEVRVIHPDGGVRWMHVESRPQRMADGRVVNHGFVEDITARKEADEALRQLQERFAVAFRASPIAASITRVADGRFLEVNERWQAVFGWRREELIGRRSVELGLWPNAAARESWAAALRDAGRLPDHLTRWRRKDGTLCDVSLSAEITEVNGEPCILAFVIDVTDRLKAERALAESEARNRRLIETANEGIWIVDAADRVSFVNLRMADMLGYPPEQIVGQAVEAFLFPEDLGEHREQIANRHKGLSGHYERRFRRKDGAAVWTQVSGTAIMDGDGSYGGAFGMFTDITYLKDQQRQLQHIAHYDALTGIPNRVLLADRMHQALAQARRAGRLMAVCYVDLDGFKPINDAWGHDAGDRVLVEIAQRLKDGLRGGDTVARLGGDEFVLLLDMENREECDTALRRVLDAIAQPLTVGGQPTSISASVGVTLYPLDDADPDTLLRHADQAMYGAKQQGRNCYQLFDPIRDRAVRAHREALDRIAAALDAGEFVLHYQPKVNMRLGSVVGVEALLRWQHPQRGLLLPAEFLPVIEDSDLVVRVGEWVIATALQERQAWQAQGLDLTISVNIAARHLSQPDFVARLIELLREHPALPPRRLELEVLETAALEDMGRVARIIEECRELGVSFALDDFGTGYSSLAYIKRLPADTLKIDQSFVRDMLRDPEDCAIVEGIVGLTRVFRRHAVAEGIETVEHGVLLLKLGCDVGQGHGIARAMPADALVDWVRGWRPDPAWVANAGFAWPSDDLPLVIAEAEHRRWIEGVESCLCGDEAPPELDPQLCRFGTWLAGAGRRRYGERPGYAAVDRLHERAHALAHELLALRRGDDREAACRRLPELQEATENLLAALHAMMADAIIH